MKNNCQILDAAATDAVVASIAGHLVDDIRKNHISEVALIGIQLRGLPLARRIAEKLKEELEIDIPVGALDISMYRDDIGKRKKLTDIHESDIPFDIDDKAIILVDDILHTGRTIRAALDAITDYGRPKLIKLAVLADRGGQEFPIRADYVGMVVDLRGKKGFLALRLVEIDDKDELRLIPSNPHI